MVWRMHGIYGECGMLIGHARYVWYGGPLAVMNSRAYTTFVVGVASTTTTSLYVCWWCLPSACAVVAVLCLRVLYFLTFVFY